jgi:hypothetical protein
MNVTGRFEKLRYREDFASTVAALLTAYRAEMAMPITDTQDRSDTGEFPGLSTAPSVTDSVACERVSAEEQPGTRINREADQELDR